MRIIAQLGAGRKPQKGSFGAMPVGYCVLHGLRGFIAQRPATEGSEVERHVRGFTLRK